MDLQPMNEFLSMVTGRRSRRPSAMEHPAMLNIMSVVSGRSSRRPSAMEHRAMHR